MSNLPAIKQEFGVSVLQKPVEGITPDEKEVIINADGLLARALQHEIDHLNGIMFIDHLEDHVKKRLRSDLKKIKKLNKES